MREENREKREEGREKREDRREKKTTKKQIPIVSTCKILTNFRQ